MALTYPIDVNATAGRWYIYDTNTQEISKISGTGNWPNGDGSEILGLSDNLVPVLAVDDERPVDIDSRLVRLEGIQDPPDIENNVLRKRWNILDRSKEEKKDVVHNIETTELGKHFDSDKLLIEVILLLGAILRQNKNLNVPAALQAFADRFQARSEKIFKNRQKIDAMLAQIEAGEQPQLDQEFEIPE